MLDIESQQNAFQIELECEEFCSRFCLIFPTLIFVYAVRFCFVVVVVCVCMRV